MQISSKSCSLELILPSTETIQMLEVCQLSIYCRRHSLRLFVKKLYTFALHCLREVFLPLITDVISLNLIKFMEICKVSIFFQYELAGRRECQREGSYTFQCLLLNDSKKIESMVEKEESWNGCHAEWYSKNCSTVGKRSCCTTHMQVINFA